MSKARKVIQISIIIIAIISIGYYLFFKKPANNTATKTTNVGTLVKDKALSNTGQGFQYDDGTKADFDTNASKISSSPLGDRFLAFIEPSQDFPVGKQIVYSASANSQILPNNAEQTHWLKDSTFVYTKNDGTNIKIFTNSPTAEAEVISMNCRYISLVVANANNLIANCLNADELHISYLINIETKTSSQLKIPDDYVISAISPDLKYLVANNPNETNGKYVVIDQTNSQNHDLADSFYPDSIKWINSSSFLALTDNLGNVGINDSNAPTSNILLKISIDQSGVLEATTVQTFNLSTIDYNIVGSKIVVLLADKSKINVNL